MTGSVTPVRFAAATTDQTARQALLDVLGMLDANPELRVVVVYDYPSDVGGVWSGYRDGDSEGQLTPNERLGMLCFAQQQSYDHATGR
jgi:hypothetical protein